MNFHQKRVPIEIGQGSRLRYEPLTSRDPPPISVSERLAAFATAPLLGSRKLFPPRFDHAFAALTADPTAAKVVPEHAIWYYGPTLHLDVDPLKLQYRISDWVHGADGIRWVGTSFLDSADWSAAISPVAKSPIHREMQEIAGAGGDPRDTRAYRNLMLAIKLGRPSRRNNITLASVEAVEAYLRY